MSEASAVLRESNSYEHKGVTGLVFSYRLPDLQACMLAGEIPLPLVRGLKKVRDGEAAEADLRAEVESIRTMRAYQERLVIAAVFALNGTPAELDQDDLREMHPDDFNAIRALAAREMDPEGKA